MELTSQVSCLQSYKMFMCRYNFPYCDPDTGEVRPICLTDCYNAYVNCGNDSASCDDASVYNNLALDDDYMCSFSALIPVT